MPVEGIPQRDVVVTFGTHFDSYNPGERACYTGGEAQALADLGVAAVDPPLNLVVPLVTQAGAVLTCTTGEWSGEPTGYAYQWKLDGTTDIGGNSATYNVTAGDVGHTATCTVSATNSSGTTVGPPSNGVIVT
jgi:hypothetical protein